jgi:hypothetical protein
LSAPGNREFVEQTDDQFLQAPFAKPFEVELEEGGVALIRVENGITFLAFDVKPADLREGIPARRLLAQARLPLQQNPRRIEGAFL